MADDIHTRLELSLRDTSERRDDELHELMTDGCAHMLALETERLLLGRRISELAVTADDAESAKELRRLWLRRRTLNAELGRLRGLLRSVGCGLRAEAS